MQIYKPEAKLLKIKNVTLAAVEFFLNSKEHSNFHKKKKKKKTKYLYINFQSNGNLIIPDVHA